MTPQNSFSTSTAAIRSTLGDLLALPQAASPEGPEAEFKTAAREHLNYGFTLAAPRHRLSPHLRLHVATARFVWMMAANNRLADIEFYEPKVAHYTDDGLTVPGSNYGMRLRQPQAGLDQVQGAIDRMNDPKEKRRAAMVIFQASDAVRRSNDIPCAFGMMLHPRDGRLDATLIMRSNNATTLLPFNIFEFSLLMEVIAVEAGLKIGTLHYFAGSMHLYEREAKRAADIVGSEDSVGEMTEMPSSVRPLEQIKILAKFEGDLRHGWAGMSAATIAEWVDRIKGELHPYWGQFALLLLAAAAAKLDARTLDAVVAELLPEYRRFAPQLESGRAKREDKQEIGGFFGSKEESTVVPFASRSELERLRQLAEGHERKTGQPIGARKLFALQDSALQLLAARGGPMDEATFETLLDALD